MNVFKDKVGKTSNFAAYKNCTLTDALLSEEFPKAFVDKFASSVGLEYLDLPASDGLNHEGPDLELLKGIILVT